MDTSGQGQQDPTRAGVGTISRRAARPGAAGRPVTAARPRPEPVPVPPADPAGIRARRRSPEAMPQPRNAAAVPVADPRGWRARRRPPQAVQQAVPQPGRALPAALSPHRNARPAPPVPPRRSPTQQGTPTRQRTPTQQAPAQAAPAQAAPAVPQQAVPQQAVPQQAVPSQGGPHATPAPAAARSHRMPFVLLLCALLGGALVSALVISTTLAEGAFQITRLQQSTNALARQRQALEEQVAQAQSAQVIESRALKLGLRPQGQLRFIDLKTGKTSADRGDAYVNSINVPGYTP